MRSPWFAGDWPQTQGYGATGVGVEPPGHGYAHWHTGIDVGLPSGTPLFIAAPGIVTDRVNPGGFGTYQTLNPDANPKATIILGHESKWDVATGHYAAGTHVGESGATGDVTGPHLHFEQDIGGPPYAAGNDVNPTVALQGGEGWETATIPADAQTLSDSGGILNQLNVLDPKTWIPSAGNALAGIFHASDFTDLLIRGGLILAGVIIVFIGIAVLTRAPERIPGIARAVGETAAVAAV